MASFTIYYQKLCMKIYVNYSHFGIHFRPKLLPTDIDTKWVVEKERYRETRVRVRTFHVHIHIYSTGARIHAVRIYPA